MLLSRGGGGERDLDRLLEVGVRARRDLLSESVVARRASARAGGLSLSLSHTHTHTLTHSQETRRARMTRKKAVPRARARVAAYVVVREQRGRPVEDEHAALVEGLVARGRDDDRTRAAGRGQPLAQHGAQLVEVARREPVFYGQRRRRVEEAA